MKVTTIENTTDVRLTCSRKIRPAGVDAQDRSNEKVLKYALTFTGAAGAPSWLYELAARPIIIQHQNAFRKAHKTVHSFLKGIETINATVSITVDASTLQGGIGKISAKEAMRLLSEGVPTTTILPMLKKAEKAMFIAAADMLRQMANDS